jgi:hypothetical protein
VNLGDRAGRLNIDHSGQERILGVAGHEDRTLDHDRGMARLVSQVQM